ncbi:hypothetical protein ACFYNW_37715 [Streptomyces virginiae]|uniref:hypothetical protein n=1 Tax=Streptomyces virginiae TaxID=1961 RepID=UPI0036E77E26
MVDLMAALQQSVQNAKAARGENAAPAEVHDLPSARKSSKKAVKRAAGTMKKAAAKRKPPHSA